ncbi:MAG: hypothetical protein R2854_03675 [Caldilineaceae bacterium]
MLILLFHPLTLAYSMVNPLGEAPDEADHWAYIVHLANERPAGRPAHHPEQGTPPLYHATAAAVSLGEPVNDFLRANPDVQFQPAPDWSPNFSSTPHWRPCLLRGGALYLVRPGRCR